MRATKLPLLCTTPFYYYYYYYLYCIWPIFVQVIFQFFLFICINLKSHLYRLLKIFFGYPKILSIFLFHSKFFKIGSAYFKMAAPRRVSNRVSNRSLTVPSPSSTCSGSSSGKPIRGPSQKYNHLIGEQVRERIVRTCFTLFIL